MKTGKEFPKFFLYLYVVLALCILIGTFFSVKIVSAVYFITFIITVVYYVLNIKYGKKLSNYKQSLVMFNIINLAAVFSIIYYEASKHSNLIITFLSLLIVIELLSFIFDVFFVKSENFNLSEIIIIYCMILGIMICVLTYLFDVSDLWYVIIAFVLELAVFILRLGFTYKNMAHSKQKQEISKEELQHIEEEKIEEIIQKPDDNSEGDIQ